MDDLIRRSDAISQSFPVTFSNGLEPYDFDVVSVAHINSVLAVDAVEVVRCGECKHNLFPGKPNSVCGLDVPIFDIYGYCSEGVRREDGDSDG